MGKRVTRSDLCTTQDEHWESAGFSVDYVVLLFAEI